MENLIEDTQDGRDCLHQCIEYFHGWRYYRYLLGQAIASQVKPIVEGIMSPNILEAYDSGEIDFETLELIAVMIRQHEILTGK